MGNPNAAPVSVLGLTPEQMFTLTAFARDTGHFRCTNAQATALADACKAVLKAGAAAAELLEAAREVADEHMGVVASLKYESDDDEVGTRVCCNTVSYREHAPRCPAVRLRAAIAKAKGEVA